jgi:hypothetical protein
VSVAVEVTWPPLPPAPVGVWDALAPPPAAATTKVAEVTPLGTVHACRPAVEEKVAVQVPALHTVEAFAGEGPTTIPAALRASASADAAAVMRLSRAYLLTAGE